MGEFRENTMMTMFLSRRDQKTGSTEPGSNRRVGVKTNSVGFSLRRLAAMLIVLLAMIQLVGAARSKKKVLTAAQKWDALLDDYKRELPDAAEDRKKAIKKHIEGAHKNLGKSKKALKKKLWKFLQLPELKQVRTRRLLERLELQSSSGSPECNHE